MNTPTTYQRRLDRTLPEPEGGFENHPSERVDELAIHRDPSVQEGPPSSEAAVTQSGVTWVRPSEMPTLLGSKVAGRGIDLQAELVRRTRRAPARMTANTSSRFTHGRISRPEPTTPKTVNREGLGL